MPEPGYLLLAGAPALLWLCWVRHHDRHAPEPHHLVALTFGLGAAAALGVLALRAPLDAAVEPWLLRLPAASRTAVDCLLVTAPLEELLKLLALLPLLLHLETDEPMDGLVHGAAAAMGFATVENATYVSMTGDLWLAAQRAFTATVVHLGCTGTAGFLLVTAKLRRRRRWLCIGGALLVPVALHGGYDLLLAFGHSSLALLCVLPAMLLLFSAKIRWSRQAARQQQRQRQQQQQQQQQSAQA